MSGCPEFQKIKKLVIILIYQHDIMTYHMLKLIYIKKDNNFITGNITGIGNRTSYSECQVKTKYNRIIKFFDDF